MVILELWLSELMVYALRCSFAARGQFMGSWYTCSSTVCCVGGYVGMADVYKVTNTPT